MKFLKWIYSRFYPKIDKPRNPIQGIPFEIRAQIVRIITEATRTDDLPFSDRIQTIYDDIVKEVDYKFGTFQLSLYQRRNSENIVKEYILLNHNIEGVIFAIELLFNKIDELFKVEGDYAIVGAPNLRPKQAIAELNKCLRQSNSGYSFENGKAIRIESSFVHEEIVKPTITLLTNKRFEIALDSYLKAHEHWRVQNNEECLIACCMAFESTMKIIIKELFKENADGQNASKLIETCFKNNLLPEYLQGHFGFLAKLLETGIPKIRNKVAHGRADESMPATDAITRYGLNLTGASIIFMIEQSHIK